ncbi:MAG: hypothetical protein HOV81_10535 [Kofleriaceae bacterium]|nr:hypothetical protein [Kofleriaceae bacterium]
MFVVCVMAGGAAANTKVGDTKDACDRSDVVTFKGKGGAKVSVKAGQTKEADMNGPVRELTWFCGGSQEASSNDVPWDHVKLKRASNGALQWTFYRLPPPPAKASAPPGQTATHRAGDTSDGCDGDKAVTFASKGGTVSVAKSQTITVDLAKPVTEMTWFCGNSKERVANDTPFDQVQISRRVNGAIKWVFLLKTAAPDPVDVCNKIRATGQLVYKDEKGKTVPLARAQVKLMDEDFGPTDQTMAIGMTDAQGRFDLTGKASDGGCVGAGCKRPDPYVEFVLYDPNRIDVRDPLGNTARVQTPTRPDSCGTINFGTQKWGGAELEPILFAYGEDAYTRFTSQTGDKRVPGNDGVVEIEYPTVFIHNTPYTTYTTIHWNWHGDSKTGFDSLHHEFGHRLRHAADGSVDHFNGDMMKFRYARNHKRDEVTNEGFAFNEGWAGYVHSALRYGDISPTWKGTNKGDNVQGDVSSQLQQLSDKCGGLEALWGTMRDAPKASIHSIDEFRAEFMKKNPSCSVADPGGTPTVTPPDEGSSSSAIVADAKLGERIRTDMLASVKLRTRLNRRSAIRPHVTVTGLDALADRQLERDQDLHEATRAAYEKALESLALPVDAIADGRYAKALAAAKAQLARDVRVAVRRHVRETKQDVEAARKTATGDAAKYLDAILASYLRVDADKVSLPKSFWPTTTR